MDSTSNVCSLNEIADLLVENLTQSGGLADLGNATLETIEREVLEHVDRVTRDALSQLLDRQARQAEPPCTCPRCGKPLSEKPAEGCSLQSQRGMIHFKREVFRCEACRLDFFPSVQNSGL